MKVIAYMVLTLLMCGCFGRKPTIETGHEGKPMPSINLLLMDSTTQINTKLDVPDKPVVLFYFSPECPYCRSMTKSITQKTDELKGIKIYMISSFPFNLVRQYASEFDLKRYSNITVGYDYELYFSQYFKAPGVPCIAIYGKDKKLKEVLMGNVSTNLIMDLAFE